MRAAGKKDKNNSLAVKWLFVNSKSQLFPMIFLIIGNALLASFGVISVLFTKNLIDSAAEGDMAGLRKNALFLLGFFVTHLFAGVLFGSVETRIQAKLEIFFRTRILRALTWKDYSAVTAFHSGELQNRLTSDIGIVTDGITTILPSLVSMLVRLLFALFMLVALDRNFAFVFLIGGTVLLIFSRIFRPLMKRLHKRVLDADGRVRSFFQEILDNLLMVKAFGIHKQVEEKSGRLQQSLFREKMRRRAISMSLHAGFGFVFQMGYLFAVVWGALGLLRGMAFGTFTASLQLVGQVQAPFAGLSGLLPRYYSLLASAERLIELETLKDEESFNDARGETDSIYERLKSIVIEDISFQYDRDVIFKNARLTVNKGDFAVISGSSGIGKSTLFKLLLGVISPNQGSIYFETDQGKRFFADKDTRNLFAYVPQGNLLISGTIRETVSFVNREVTEEEILRAAKIACADSFIGEFPQGLDTPLGEKGKGLSEGQVQRLSILRAILSGAPVLLFDEATSALDEETEERLLSNIKAMRDKTCIIISHKKAAFSVCNKEIVLRDKALYVKDFI